MTYTILQAELAQGPCPACGQPITYDYAIDATELQTITLEASKTVVDMQVNATVVGVRIHHDCIPNETGPIADPYGFVALHDALNTLPAHG